MAADEETPFRLGTYRQGAGIAEFRYGDRFELQESETRQRLLIAPAGRQIDLLQRMLREANEPFSVLYILLVPGGESEPGRYAIGGLTLAAVNELLDGFREFFEGDARHHLWVGSERDDSLLAYDQHNVIYAYGDVEQYASILVASGLTQEDVEFPFPHTHHFRTRFDVDEDRLLRAYPWTRSPLAEEDL